MSLLVLRGNIYRPGILFARVASGASKPAVKDLVRWLNVQLDITTSDYQERDQLARFWIGQDQERIFPTHCKYLVYQSFGKQKPFLITPLQQPLPDLIRLFMPVGL